MPESRFREHPFVDRTAWATRAARLRPGYTPVVAESADGTFELPTGPKMLFKDDISIAQLQASLRSKLPALGKDEALFVFVKGDQGDILPPASNTVRQIHDAYADPDGFLYLTYTRENVFGSG